MDSYKYHEAATYSVRMAAVFPLLVTFLLVPLSFLIPVLDSTRAPFMRLDTGYSTIALGLSDSADIFGATLLALVLIVIMASRSRLSPSYRIKEALVLAGVAILFAGGGSWINEHKVKELIKQPRPNIEWLANDHGTGQLGMTAAEFYALGDKSQRRAHLKTVLDTDPVVMSTAVKNHWLEETGYSLPSGHSFSAFFFATFFLCIGCTFMVSWRRYTFYLLLPWALLTCYARLVLRVHTPADITVGAGMGLVLGIVAWLVARAMIRQLVHKEITH